MNLIRSIDTICDCYLTLTGRTFILTLTDSVSWVIRFCMAMQLFTIVNDISVLYMYTRGPHFASNSHQCIITHYILLNWHFTWICLILTDTAKLPVFTSMTCFFLLMKSRRRQTTLVFSTCTPYKAFFSQIINFNHLNTNTRSWFFKPVQLHFLLVEREKKMV